MTRFSITFLILSGFLFMGFDTWAASVQLNEEFRVCYSVHSDKQCARLHDVVDHKDFVVEKNRRGFKRYYRVKEDLAQEIRYKIRSMSRSVYGSTDQDCGETISWQEDQQPLVRICLTSQPEPRKRKLRQTITEILQTR